MTAVTRETAAMPGRRYAPIPARGDTAQAIEQMVRRLTEANHQNRPVPPPFDGLTADLGDAVSRRWRQPCEAAFEFILAHSPGELARLIESRELAAADLTFAAEILGRADDGGLVRAALVPLLGHAQAVVREGAIYGLSRHLDNDTRTKLRALATSDTSGAVRAAAGGALDV